VRIRFGTTLAAGALICALTGCGRENTVACEATERYSTAISAPPVSIPDDLSPPDETNSLRLPAETGPTVAPTRPCLESPPGFYADGAPGSGRAGGNAPGRPDDEPAAAPPVPAAPPADDPDRQIGN
jgi:hypothetical protein